MLLVLLILLLIGYGMRRVAARAIKAFQQWEHPSAQSAPQSPNKAPTRSRTDALLTDPDLSAWTVLDDLQVARLLRSSSERQDGVG